MFFRREKPRTLTFEDRMDNARKLGFATSGTGKAGEARVIRNGCAAVVEDRGADVPLIGRAGLLVGDQIAYLVDGGYQKFFQAADGKKYAAQAAHLKALHSFKEDLREALGATSFYNESLGSTSATHLYDRVKDRDRGVPERPWEHKDHQQA